MTKLRMMRMKLNLTMLLRIMLEESFDITLARVMSMVLMLMLGCKRKPNPTFRNTMLANIPMSYKIPEGYYRQDTLCSPEENQSLSSLCVKVLKFPWFNYTLRIP